MNCTPTTLEFYKYTAGFFLSWCEDRNVTTPQEVTACQVREYLALLAVYRRLTKQTGVHVTLHAMRRSFTILALHAEMNPLHLQALAGWEDMTMLKHYAQLEDADLLAEHAKHSPVDRL